MRTCMSSQSVLCKTDVNVFAGLGRKQNGSCRCEFQQRYRLTDCKQFIILWYGLHGVDNYQNSNHKWARCGTTEFDSVNS